MRTDCPGGKGDGVCFPRDLSASYSSPLPTRPAVSSQHISTDSKNHTLTMRDRCYLISFSDLQFFYMKESHSCARV